MSTRSLRRAVPRNPLTFPTLQVLCPHAQYMEILAKSREGGPGTTEYFRRLDARLKACWNFMPAYRTLSAFVSSGTAKAFLHYHNAATYADWWITEKPEPGDLWVSGLAEYQGRQSYGAFSLGEVFNMSARLDLNWEPTEIRLINPNA